MSTILLVEDNEMNRDMLTRRLQRKGYEMMTAVDGEQVEVVLAVSLPDLILMDINLPGKDGHEITRELKSDPRTAAIPVIALTGIYFVWALLVEMARRAVLGIEPLELWTNPYTFQMVQALAAPYLLGTTVTAAVILFSAVLRRGFVAVIAGLLVVFR